MIRNIKILAMIMAGGRGERLYPLTLDRTKPSVPFAGKYRIIDFVLSNFINSGIYSIYVLVQYKSQSLIEHIRSGWKRQGMLSSHFITVVPPQMRRGQKEWYRGTADSIYQNINLILDFKPDLVAVFGGDHIYRMNINDMIHAHITKKADVTVACMPCCKEQAGAFGIVDIDANAMVKRFREKPKNLSLIRGQEVFISMGNYIFSTNALIESLRADDAYKNSSHDFGKDVIPSLVAQKKRVFSYDFSKNKVPGLKPYEKKEYWQDVGTIKSFWQSNMEILGENPVFDLDNRQWPIYASSLDCPPAKIVKSEIVNSCLAEGCILSNAFVKNSILGRSVILEADVEIENSIIMDFCLIKKGAKIRNAIIDRFNVIPAHTRIGYNRLQDARAYHYDVESGIVVVKRGARQVLYW